MRNSKDNWILSPRDLIAELVAADPITSKTERWLPTEVYSSAFDAWAVARKSAFDDWIYLTDPNNLLPDSPKAFRDAYQLVQKSGQFLTQSVQLELLGKLNAVPSKKVERAVRAAMAIEGSDQDKINEIKKEVEAAGIQKYQPPKPLEIVSESQVKLVCWMAVKSA